MCVCVYMCVCFYIIQNVNTYNKEKWLLSQRSALFWHAKLYFNQSDKGAIDWSALSTEGHQWTMETQIS